MSAPLSSESRQRSEPLARCGPEIGALSPNSTNSKAYSVYYIYDTDDNPQGWGGTDRGGYTRPSVRAIDYKTGEVRWAHEWEGATRTGVLSNAGQPGFRLATALTMRRQL